jgi:Leucine-rich repeat (LRR) protein
MQLGWLIEIDDIGACIELTRIDLSNNMLTSLQGIAHNKSISWLKAANNKLTSMTDLSRLTKLAGSFLSSF